MYFRTTDQAISLLNALFQWCFDSGKIPSVWKQSIIIPGEKSKDNDPRIPLNYHGISLVCCSGRIYSSVLNNHQFNYFDDENIICDEQNGLCKDRSCRDHIFVLDSILKNRKSQNNSGFEAFIDFQKALQLHK